MTRDWDSPLLPDDSSDTESLMQAMGDYMDAKRAHDGAREKYHDGGGWSWGYAGSDEINAVERAAREVQTRLAEYVDKRVEAAVARALAKRDDP